MDIMQTYKDIRIYCLVFLLGVLLPAARGQLTPDPCDTSFLCPTLIVLADPTDCRVRYECSGSTLTRLECPPGQEYHSLTQLCVRAGRAACRAPCPGGALGVRAAYEQGNPLPTSSVLPASIDPLLPDTSGSDEEDQPPQVDPCSEDYQEQCVKVLSINYYVFPDPQDCQKYYQCVNGFSYRRDCAAGTRFDAATRRCLHTSESTCFSCPPSPVTGTPVWDIQELDPCSSSLEEDCRRLRGDAEIPKADDCGAYYTCKGGTLSPINCGKTSQYDATRKQCVVQREANCFSCPSVAPPETSTPRQHGTDIQDLDPCSASLMEDCRSLVGEDKVPNVNDCGAYYTCKAGTLDSVDCNRNLLYDTDTMECVPPGRATCLSCPGGSNVPPSAPTAQPGTLNPCSNNLTEECAETKLNVMIPDIHNCRKYYSCSSGVLSSETCKANTKFDSLSQTCTDTATCFGEENCPSGEIYPCQPREAIRQACRSAQYYSRIPDPDDCTGYYECNKALNPRKCVGATKYDFLQRTCVDEALAVCYNCTATRVDPCSADLQAQCKQSQYTFDLIDTTSCNAYYHCTGGELDSRSCPDGQAFDRGNLVCTDEAVASCVDVCGAASTAGADPTTAVTTAGGDQTTETPAPPTPSSAPSTAAPSTAAPSTAAPSTADLTTAAATKDSQEASTTAQAGPTTIPGTTTARPSTTAGLVPTTVQDLTTEGPTQGKLTPGVPTTTPPSVTSAKSTTASTFSQGMSGTTTVSPTQSLTSSQTITVPVDPGLPTTPSPGTISTPAPEAVSETSPGTQAPTPTQGATQFSVTETTTSSSSVNPCFRLEPCVPGTRVADPENCDKYFQCEQPGRGMSVLGWKRRQCTQNYKFDFLRLECVDTATGTRCQKPCPGPDHSMSVSTPDAKEGSPLEFKCVYYESMSSTQPARFPSFRWTLNGLTIRGEAGSRVTVETGPVDAAGYRTSTLRFRPLTYQDSGLVACLVDSALAPTAQSIRIEVLARPRAFLTPRTEVVPSGDKVTIDCSATVPRAGQTSPGSQPTFTWYRNGLLLNATTLMPTETIVPVHDKSTLTSVVTKAVTYSCEAVNPAGPSERVAANVYVYNISDTPLFCPTETTANVKWLKSTTGLTVEAACPPGMRGVAVRRCRLEMITSTQREGRWGRPDLSACVSRNVALLADTTQSIQDGIGADNATHILQLVLALENTTKTPTALPPGDIDKTVEIVNSLAFVRERNESEISVDELQALINTVSNLLDQMNEESWEVLKHRDMFEGIDLMKAVDIYGDVSATQTQNPGLRSVMSKNLMLQVECVLKNELQTLVFPHRGSSVDDWLGDEANQITVDKPTLEAIRNKVRGKVMSFSSAYYKSLTSVVPESAEYGDTGSNILSLSVASVGRLRGLEPPVHLELNIYEQYAETNLTALCGFWDFGLGNNGNWSTEGCELVSTNGSRAYCQCNHLTNFAILMSTHKPDDTHAVILSIITTVGLIISLVCLVLTIVLYIVMWKHIKSHHAVVLINLCIALIVANVLFLAGVDKTNYHLMCTIIAVLLHYFYLAAFFIMLVEGIQLLLYVVYVFHVRRKRETTMLLIAGWFLPAVVVAVSLGITNMEGYGNELFCWLDVHSGLIWAFVGPVLAIIFINIIILIVVLRRASNSNANLRLENKKRHRIRSAFWNIVVITPIVGVAWVFGVFAVNEDTVAFQYIFAIFNSLQGLLIFIFHGICNKRKGRYSVKHPSRTTKRSRLKSDTSGKSSKTGKNSKESKGSSVPSSPGTEPPRDLFPMSSSDTEKLNPLEQLREDRHMSWRNSRVFYSNGTSTFTGSELSSQTDSTLVDSSVSNGADPPSSAANGKHCDVSSADIQASVQEVEKEPTGTRKEPVSRVLSSTSC